MIWRLLSSTFIMLLVVAAVAFGVWLNEPTTFPIRVVRIEGNLQYLDRKELEQTLSPLVSGGFFSIDASALYKALQANPWVESGGIRRIWPDTVTIQVQERQPIARWNKRSLIDAHGHRFRVNNQDEFENLPILQGPKGQYKTVLREKQYIEQVLQPLNLQLKRISLSDRMAYDAELSNGVVMRLGVNQLDERLARFVKMYPAITKHQQKIGTVDLRYSNGIAVGM